MKSFCPLASFICFFLCSNSTFLLWNHQESPTKELTEHILTSGTEDQSSGGQTQEKLNASDDSSDGNISEESEYFFTFTVKVSETSAGSHRFSVRRRL